MSDLYIDPVTKDYVLEDGRWVVDEDLDTAVFLCLETKRGTRIGDEDFGSDLHKLKKDPVRSAERAPALVKQALKPLFDDGSITSATTTTEALADGIVLYITIVTPGGKPATFRVFREVGP